MQKWEYLIVLRSRGFKPRPNDEYSHEAMYWTNLIITKTDEKKWEGKIIDLLIKLGDDGWELVSASTESGRLGGAHSIEGTITPSFGGGSKGKTEGITTDFAGFTNRKEWIFKRQR